LDREALTRNDYEPIHQARLENSKDQFFDAVIDEIIEAEGKHVNLDELTEENIRRGSSFEELRPYAEELNTLVATACKEVEAKIKPGDDRRLSLEDLQARGLQVGKQSIDLYEQVVYHYAEQLPNNSIGLISPLITPFATPSWRHEIDARRLDESISAEAQLKGELLATEKEIQRLKDELQRIGKPVGVVSAVWVLGLLSLLGIVFPVVVMATEPETLSPLLRWLLVSSFIIGLIGLLAYTVWYHRQLNGQERG
jgi:hypothetical protein